MLPQNCSFPYITTHSALALLMRQKTGSSNLVFCFSTKSPACHFSFLKSKRTPQKMTLRQAFQAFYKGLSLIFSAYWPQTPTNGNAFARESHHQSVANRQHRSLATTHNTRQNRFALKRLIFTYLI